MAYKIILTETAIKESQKTPRTERARPTQEIPERNLGKSPVSRRSHERQIQGAMALQNGETPHSMPHRRCQERTYCPQNQVAKGRIQEVGNHVVPPWKAPMN